jgi:hypothetical protein
MEGLMKKMGRSLGPGLDRKMNRGEEGRYQSLRMLTGTTISASARLKRRTPAQRRGARFQQF